MGAGSSRAASTVHIKARSSPYCGGSGPARCPVPDDKVLWKTTFPGYAPVVFVADSVAAGPVWADDAKKAKNIHFNHVDGKVNRTSFEGKYAIGKDDMPLNPRGRTGMVGQGLLGRLGPNHAADPIVTRWKRDDDGAKVSPPLLEFCLIKRKDNDEWAFPGGMVDAGEEVSLTLKREFGEETLNSIEASPERLADIQQQIAALFKAGKRVYRGYVDDPRNTDNCWMETTAVNFHDETGAATGAFKLQAGDDAGDVAWVEGREDLKLYASHSEFMAKVRKMHHAV